MVTQKGVPGLQKASRTRDENKLDFYPGQVLHTKCRHDYCNVNVIKRDLSTKRKQWSPSKKANLRSSTKFDFANDCLLCGRSTRDHRKKSDVSVYQARTSSCQTNLELLCLQRGPGDKLAETVKGRIEYAQDLHAADAVYHQHAKSVYIYLQQMQTLQEQHPEVFSAFLAGYHFYVGVIASEQGCQQILSLSRY
ncbi:hypothetical protein PoB_007568200 [Plakobranchus ocellatus]|uniref:Uncharacterized protein n=1 Tax=Plakobranchus ocellatus TaxID=259542 RepID=A0AAV4DYS2_9GAST|nr:hypothetical protein PoB_007568200 [Plakobranchus ocellatus]